MSVITPTLNQVRYITWTLNSVSGQTYRPIEHIVVDGGSTDGTAELLAGRQSSAIRWVSGPDRGMYDAVNKGIGLANGEILAYLNSDDMYLPWTVETVVDYFVQHPEVGVVYGDYLRLDDETGRHTLLLQPPYESGYIARTGFVPQPTAFWRRSVHAALGGFDSSLQFVADCDFWMRAGALCRVEKIDEVLAVDRIQLGAKRSVDQPGLVRELELVRQRHAPSRGIVRPVLDRFYALVWRRLQLGRFVMAAAREPTGTGPWARTLEARLIRIRPLHLLMALIPRVGVRYLSSAVEIQPSVFGSPIHRRDKTECADGQ